MLELLLECLIVLIPEWLAWPNHSINQAIRQSSNQRVFLSGGGIDFIGHVISSGNWG